MSHRILTADYHRNGVGGAGFYVAIVQTSDSADSEAGRYLVTWFPEYDEPSGAIDYAKQSRMAVVNLTMAHKGNIGMHPITDPNGVLQEGTGGNAWRGSDRWGHAGELYRLIHEWVGI